MTIFKEYMEIILSQKMKNSIFIDKYLMRTELEVDESVTQTIILILGIIEHIERFGIHSGNSTAVYPS